MNNQEDYLLQALAQAEIRRGFCAPNPAVGAVVVRDNTVIAAGHHWAAGHPHAEVEALTKLTEAKGATLYVTLEPCCHYGKTPPCTEFIIQRGIKAVYYGFQDPNPRVAGKGRQHLLEAGIVCEYIPVPAIESFYQSYAYWQATQKPWLTAKLALSLDGKTAGIGGQPFAITSAELNQHTHYLRKKSDAILTTLRTLARDNPQLNVRLNNEVQKKPLYVLDSRLEFSPNLRVMQSAQHITLFHGDTINQDYKKYLQSFNIDCIAVQELTHRLNLLEIINHIGRDGVHDLWIEAGGTLFQSLVEANLLQRGLIYVAPKYLGENALSAFHGHINFLASAKHVKWYSKGIDAICELEW